MAQSPTESAGSAEVLRYDLGWKAINDLLRKGRSLSAHERNSCFLNLGQEQTRFADASSALNLDLDDDGRVLALSDWDFDGDIDFWIANRSGPQIRFLRNDTPSPAQRATFFRLSSSSGNHDAIGARVSLLTSTGRRLTESLRAGEGYLSQNSKWLHFGTGDAETITRVTVRWPNGRTQEFQDLPAGKRYLLFEGKPDPLPWTPPKLNPYSASPLIAPTHSDHARLSLLKPLPLPALDGLTEDITKARLVTLWLSTCPTCLGELREWKSHAADFEKSGIEIVAVNVDEKEDPSVWNQIDAPFTYQFGTPALVEKFDVLQRSLLSRQRPLPVPSSFLIDSLGQLRAVYKGPVSPERLLADVALIDASPADILSAATPFPGRWHTPPGGSSPLNIAIKFLEGGYLTEGQAYIDELTANPAQTSAPLLNLLAALYLDQERFGDAAQTFHRTLRLAPDDRKANAELVVLYLAAKRGVEAERHLQPLLTHDGRNPALLLQLSKAQLLQGQRDRAIATLESAPQTAEVIQQLRACQASK
ncbi:MAG: ASPIC/UnbV domain-containing protein [Akkermansiaceae bacterium]